MDEQRGPGGERSFEEQSRGGNPGLAREIWDLIRHNKKWWLIPVIIVLLAIGVLVIMGSGVAATFIYPLF